MSRRADPAPPADPGADPGAHGDPRALEPAGLTADLAPDGLAAIEAIVRRAADEVVAPLFGRLLAHQVMEKAPGDVVTVADRLAEEFLEQELTRLLPGSRVVGEEAVSVDPGVLALLAGPDPVWIVDPVDGTDAFATGSPRFSTLVALALDGVVLASWTYAPVLGILATATLGGGAFVDGRRISAARPARPGIRHLDVVLPQPKWWTEEARVQFNRLFHADVSPAFFDAAGLQYIELASGRRGAMVMSWEFPWDHAAGQLLHAEAGGHCASATGEPFRLAGGNALPLVAAADRATVQALHRALAPPSDAARPGG